MSLKAFHLFFIAISVLLAVGMGAMTLQAFLERHALAQLGWSLLSFAGAIALIVYGVYIRKKLRNVGFLVATVCFISLPRAAYACSSCYGNPEAPQTQAMNMAILFMLLIVAVMLSLFAAFFVHLRIHAKRAAEETLDSRGPNPYLEVNVND